MSILLPSERLSFLSLWVSEFRRSLELCDRSLLRVGRASIAPLTTEGHLRACAPFWCLSALTLRDGFSALQSSSGVELALLPSPQRVAYEHAAPLWASEVPLIWGMSVRPPELAVGRASFAPSPRGSSMSIPLPFERLSFSHSEEWVLRPPELVLVELALLPSSRGLSMSRAAPFWASEFPSHSDEWVLRSLELCDRSLSVLVELAWLPSP